MQNTIRSVDRTSPLRHKVKSGWRLLRVNDHEILDVLDYKFYTYESRLELIFEDQKGKQRRVRLKKDLGGDIGLDFETYLMDETRNCSNHCPFCFVDQLPQGMRETLYFKDDDARLSFLTGSYITMTNLSEREIQRICNLLEQEQLYLNCELKVADIADKLGTNKRYISDCINTQKGITFVQLVNNYRIDYAKQLLKSSPDIKITEVFIKSGFANETSFFRVFKALTGLTPNQYKFRKDT